MWTLLNYRIWLVLALSLALLGSHWKAYRIGGDRVTSAWAVERAAQALERAQESEANRAKEKALNQTVEALRHDYAKLKAARAADNLRSAHSLRDFKTALDSAKRAAGRDAETASRVNAAIAAIAEQCTKDYRDMDEAARERGAIAEALQTYIREVLTNAKGQP